MLLHVVKANVIVPQGFILYTLDIGRYDEPVYFYILATVSWESGVVQSCIDVRVFHFKQ